MAILDWMARFTIIFLCSHPPEMNQLSAVMQHMKLTQAGMMSRMAMLQAFSHNGTQIVQSGANTDMVMTFPIMDHSGNALGYIVISESIQHIEESLHTLLTGLLFGTIVAVALAGASGYALTSNVGEGTTFTVGLLKMS